MATDAALGRKMPVWSERSQAAGRLLGKGIVPREALSSTKLKGLKISGKGELHDWICVLCQKSFHGLAADGHVAHATHKKLLKEKQLEAAIATLPPSSHWSREELESLLQSAQHQCSAALRGQAGPRASVAGELQTLLQTEFPDVTVELFGSSASGFALADSDVNLSLCIPNAQENLLRIPKVMKGVLELISDSGDPYDDVREDFFAFNKIPRILFKHTPSNLECEIRILAGMPMGTSALLGLYGSIDDRALKLGLLLRYWAKLCRCDEQDKGHYPAHMFVVLVIHYLQRTDPPVLPILHELQEPPPDAAAAEAADGRGKREDGENSKDGAVTVRYLNDLTEIRAKFRGTNSQSLAELWFGLLRYYCTEFKIDKQAVSIRQLCPLERVLRGWGTARLAVEDPLIPRSNLGRGAAMDKVFGYLMSNLKLTLAYFVYGPSLPPFDLANLRPDIIKDVDKWKQEGDRQHGSHTATPSATQVAAQSSPGGVLQQQSEDGDAPAPAPTVPPQPCPETATEGSEHGGGVADTESNSAPDRDVSVNRVGHGSLADGRSIDMDDSSIVLVGGPSCQSWPELSVDTETESTEKVVHEGSEVIEAFLSLQIAEPSGAETVESCLQAGLNETASMTSDSPIGSKAVPPPMHADASRKGGKAQFAAKNFVLATSYPQACNNCKKSSHVVLDCPEEQSNRCFQKELPPVLPDRNCLLAMNTAFRGYMKVVMLPAQECKWRQDVCDFILTDIHRVFPTAGLQLFGSSSNGFGSVRSDLDLCMTLEGVDLDKEEIIKKIARELAESSDYRDISCIFSARVPIVKFVMTQWNLECDISLENRLALRNTGLLRTYANIDNRVKILGYTVKHFAKVCDMGDASTGSLSSYAYILLLIHYLQRTTPPVLPVLQQIGPGEHNSPTIGPWNCYYFEPKSPHHLAKVWPHVANSQDVTELWLGFLRYFAAEFDWTREVVVIDQIEPLSKFDKWWMGKPMCIMDPFNLEHNLGSSVGSRMRMYILQRFLNAIHHHSKNNNWRNMDHLMDPGILIGDERPPKFIICDNCGKRGHKAATCPAERETREARVRIPGKFQKNRGRPRYHQVSRNGRVSSRSVQVPMRQERHTVPQGRTEIISTAHDQQLTSHLLSPAAVQSMASAPSQIVERPVHITATQQEPLSSLLQTPSVPGQRAPNPLLHYPTMPLQPGSIGMIAEQGSERQSPLLQSPSQVVVGPPIMQSPEVTHHPLLPTPHSYMQPSQATYSPGFVASSSGSVAQRPPGIPHSAFRVSTQHYTPPVGSPGLYGHSYPPTRVPFQQAWANSYPPPALISQASPPRYAYSTPGPAYVESAAQKRDSLSPSTVQRSYSHPQNYYVAPHSAPASHLYAAPPQHSIGTVAPMVDYRHYTPSNPIEAPNPIPHTTTNDATRQFSSMPPDMIPVHGAVIGEAVQSPRSGGGPPKQSGLRTRSK